MDIEYFKNMEVAILCENKKEISDFIEFLKQNNTFINESDIENFDSAQKAIFEYCFGKMRVYNADVHLYEGIEILNFKDEYFHIEKPKIKPIFLGI